MDCTQVLDCSDLEEVTYDQKVEVGKLKIKDEEFTVYSGKNTIGRDPEFCSIVLNNMTLSKEHAVIEVAQSNSHVIYDLGSKNKTKLGKVGLAPHVRYFLPHKTVLQFGEVLAEYIILEETGNKHTVVYSDDDMIPATPAQPPKFAPELSSNSASPTLFEISTQCDCGTPETCGKLLGEPCGIDSTGKQTSRETDLDQAGNGVDYPVSSRDLMKESKCDEVKLKDVCAYNCTPLKEVAANKIDRSVNKISVEDEDSSTDDEIYCAATQIVSSADRDFKETRQSDGIPSTIDETVNSSFFSDSSVRYDTKQSLDRKSVSSLLGEYIETDFKKPMAKRNSSSAEKSFQNDMKLVELESKQNDVNNLVGDGVSNVSKQSVPYVNCNQNQLMDEQIVNKSFDCKNVNNCGTLAENQSIPEVSGEVKIEYLRKDVQKNINISTTHGVISPSNNVDKNFTKPVVDVEEEAIDIYNACTQVLNPLEKTPDQQMESNGELVTEDINNAATQIFISPGTVLKKSDQPVERYGGEEEQDIHNAATQVLVSSGSVVEITPHQCVERTGDEMREDIHSAATQVFISPGTVKKSDQPVGRSEEEEEQDIYNAATQVIVPRSSVSPNHKTNKSERSAEINDELYVAPTQNLPSVVKISCKKEEIDIKRRKGLNKKTSKNHLNKEGSNQELKDKKSNIGDSDHVDESFFYAPTQVINHDTDLNVVTGNKSPLSTSSTYSSIHEDPTQCMDEIATPTELRNTASDNTGKMSASNVPSKACETVGALLQTSSSSLADVNSVAMELFSPTKVVSKDIEVEKRLVEENKSPLSTSSTYGSIHEEPTQCMDEVAASVPGSNDVVATSTPILPSKAYEKAGTSMSFMSCPPTNANNVVDCGATSENQERVEKASSSVGVANESMDLVIPSSEELIKVSKTIYGNTSDSDTEKNSSPVIRTRSLRSANFRNRQKVKRCLRSIKDSDFELSVSSSEEIHDRKRLDTKDSQVPLFRRSSRKVANQERDTCKEIKDNKFKNLMITKEKKLSVPKSPKENLSRGENLNKSVSHESSNRPSRLRKMTWKVREASHSPAADDCKIQSAIDNFEGNSKERKIESVPLKNDEQIFQTKSVSDNHSKSSERGVRHSFAMVLNKNERDSNVLPVDSKTKNELMVKKPCVQNKKEMSSKKNGNDFSKLKSKKTSQENLDKATKPRDSIISSKSPPRLSENTFRNLKNDIKSFQDNLSTEKKSARRSTRTSDVETRTGASNSPILTSSEVDHNIMTRQKRYTRSSEISVPTTMLKKMEKTVGRLRRRISSSVSVAVDDNDSCAPAFPEECEGSPKKDSPKRKSSRFQKESTNLVSKKENTRSSHAAKMKDLPNEVNVSNEVEKEKTIAWKKPSRKGVGVIVPLGEEVNSHKSSTIVEKCDTLEKSVALKRSSRKCAGTAAPLVAEVISSRSSKIVEKCDTLENATDNKRRKKSDSVCNRITTSTTCDSTKELDYEPGSPVIQTRTRKVLKKDNESSSEKACRSKRPSTVNKEKMEESDKKSSPSKKSLKSVDVTSSSCDDNESIVLVNSKVKRQRFKKIAEENCVSTPVRNLKRNVQSENKETLSSVGESTPKRSCRVSLKPQYHVLYTGVSTSKEEEIAIKKLGGKIVEEVDECSVLVTDKVRRTLKFLCILAQGKPIVSKEWILKSQRIGHFLDPWDFIVEDKEAEKKYKFQLKVSLQKAAMKKLLDGYFVYATRSINPPPSEMKDIIEYSGGNFLSQEPSSNSWPDKSFVIASINDKRLVTKFKKLSVNIVHAELILTGVLQQKLNFNEYVLSC